mgnify:CR=1 FL=1
MTGPDPRIGPAAGHGSGTTVSKAGGTVKGSIDCGNCGSTDGVVIDGCGSVSVAGTVISGCGGKVLPGEGVRNIGSGSGAGATFGAVAVASGSDGSGSDGSGSGTNTSVSRLSVAETGSIGVSKIGSRTGTGASVACSGTAAVLIIATVVSLACGASTGTGGCVGVCTAADFETGSGSIGSNGINNSGVSSSSIFRAAVDVGADADLVETCVATDGAAFVEVGRAESSVNVASIVSEGEDFDSFTASRDDAFSSDDVGFVMNSGSELATGELAGGVRFRDI